MKKRDGMDADETFFREVSEEVKNESIRKFWNQYGLYMIAALAVVLTAAVSFETFKAWKLKRNQTWADTYSYALSLQNQGKYDESIVVLDKMQQANHGIYADIARLQTANILFEQGKQEEALNILNILVQNKKVNGKLRNMAAVKLASYKLDTAPSEEIKELLRPLVDENTSWRNIALEMLAMLAIRDKDIDGAKKMYTDILNTDNVPEALKARVQDMLSILDSEQ